MELLAQIPAWYYGLTFFVLGTIIGSFLNVYLYRFHTNRSLGGSSHCLTCTVQLQWFELVPLVGLTHQLNDPEMREALFARIVAFFGQRLR